MTGRRWCTYDREGQIDNATFPYSPFLSIFFSGVAFRTIQNFETCIGHLALSPPKPMQRPTEKMTLSAASQTQVVLWRVKTTLQLEIISVRAYWLEMTTMPKRTTLCCWIDYTTARVFSHKQRLLRWFSRLERLEWFWIPPTMAALPFILSRIPASWQDLYDWATDYWKLMARIVPVSLPSKLHDYWAKNPINPSDACCFREG